MSRRKLIWLFLAALPLWPEPGAAAEGDIQDIKDVLALAVYAPRPTYPYEARARRITGSGICVVDVDPGSGAVTDETMTQSTGSPILDNSAVSAFRNWRFRPGTVKKVRIPITFTLSGVSYSAAEVRVLHALPMEKLLTPLLGKGNVINAPIPVYPQHTLGMQKQGRGVYEIHVNKDGTVNDVKILKSSGDATFDQVTVDTLRQWHLRHGPKIIELPLVFVLTPNNYGVWIQ